MVVGSGLIARAFHSFVDDENIIIFASGVSNSLETDEKCFVREKNLINATTKANPNKKLIYFSTCSIDDQTVNSRPYVQHKKSMEDFIAVISNNYIIFRLSNIVGNGGNKNTIFNYLVSSIKENKAVDIWKNASRNLLDVTDLYLAVREVLKEGEIANEVVNLANMRSYKIPEIVIEIEKFLNKKAIVNVEYKGTLVDIDISRTERILNHVLGVDNKVDNYIEVLLKKHFYDEK